MVNLAGSSGQNTPETYPGFAGSLISLIPLISLKCQVGAGFYHVFQGTSGLQGLTGAFYALSLSPGEGRFSDWKGEYGPECHTDGWHIDALRTHAGPPY